MVTADSLATASQIRQQHDNSLGLKLLVARLYLLQVNTLPRALNPRVRCAFLIIVQHARWVPPRTHGLSQTTRSPSSRQ